MQRQREVYLPGDQHGQVLLGVLSLLALPTNTKQQNIITTIKSRTVHIPIRVCEECRHSATHAWNASVGEHELHAQEEVKEAELPYAYNAKLLTDD